MFNQVFVNNVTNITNVANITNITNVSGGHAKKRRHNGGGRNEPMPKLAMYYGTCGLMDQDVVNRMSDSELVGETVKCVGYGARRVGHSLSGMARGVGRGASQMASGVGEIASGLWNLVAMAFR